MICLCFFEMFVCMVCSLLVLFILFFFVLGFDLVWCLLWFMLFLELEGWCFVIIVEDFGLCVCFCCCGGVFYMFFVLSFELELELCVGVGDFVVFIWGIVDVDMLFFQCCFKIVGDMEFGLIVKNWFDVVVCLVWFVCW